MNSRLQGCVKTPSHIKTPFQRVAVDCRLSVCSTPYPRWALAKRFCSLISSSKWRTGGNCISWLGSDAGLEVSSERDTSKFCSSGADWEASTCASYAGPDEFGRSKGSRRGDSWPDGWGGWGHDVGGDLEGCDGPEYVETLVASGGAELGVIINSLQSRFLW